MIQHAFKPRPQGYRSVGRRSAAISWVAAVIFLNSLGCGGPQSENPNVILISIDTLRRDHCSVYGYEHATTPNLSKLAAEGAKFDLAYAPTSVTAPAHSTMFTGLYPLGHGVVLNGLTLSEEHNTLTEVLVNSDYRASAVVSSFVLDARFGLQQGFTYYHDDFDPGSATLKMRAFAGHHLERGNGFDRRADVTTRLAIERLEYHAGDDAPFFLFVHYMDPHRPYVPPADFADKFAPTNEDANILEQEIGKYDAEIAFTDYEVGRLLLALERLNLRDNTMVVVTSDHGEGLMQHDVMAHGYNIHEEQVVVPLLLRWPAGISAGQVFSDPVELVDIMPTVVELLGLPTDRLNVQGRSLAGALTQQSSLQPDRTIFLHRRHYQGGPVETRDAFFPFRPFRKKEVLVKGTKFGLRQNHWKFIQGGEEGPDELFDLRSDPQELQNIAVSFPEEADRLRAVLNDLAYFQHHGAGGQPAVIDEEVIRRLRSMGYIR